MSSSFSHAVIDPNGILHLPLTRFLRFLDNHFAKHSPLHLLLGNDLHDLADFPVSDSLPPVQLNLHLDSPDFPIEDNAATLLFAIACQLPAIPVTLSGPPEAALHSGLLSPAEFCDYTARPSPQHNLPPN